MMSQNGNVTPRYWWQSFVMTLLPFMRVSSSAAWTRGPQLWIPVSRTCISDNKERQRATRWGSNSAGKTSVRQTTGKNWIFVVSNFPTAGCRNLESIQLFCTPQDCCLKIEQMSATHQANTPKWCRRGVAHCAKRSSCYACDNRFRLSWSESRALAS